MSKSWKQGPAFDRAAIKGSLLGFAGDASALLVDSTFKLRHSLPEPFDYAQHAGNVAASTSIGALLGVVVTALYGSFGSQEKHSQRRMRALATVSATVVGAVANAAFETRTGIRLLHMEAIAGTADPLDFVYGVASSALAGGVTTSFRNEQPPLPTPPE